MRSEPNYTITYVPNLKCFYFYEKYKNVINCCCLFSGLPLGIYTNHWHRTANMAKAGLFGDSCQGFDGGGRCPRSSEYAPDLDYDLQGIFEGEDLHILT